MQIALKTNLSDITRRIKSYREQIPQATSATLTQTAFDIRKEIVQNTWPKSVFVRNQRFMNAALRVEVANKRRLTSAVYDSLKKDYLARLDSAGTKVPFGNHLAIAGREVKDFIRTGSGQVKKAYKPRTLLDKKRFFKATLKTGADAIIERPAGKEQGKRKATRLKRGPLKVWYLLEPKANIAKKFPFYQTANEVIKRRLEPNFRNAFRRAVMTRR